MSVDAAAAAAVWRDDLVTYMEREDALLEAMVTRKRVIELRHTTLWEVIDNYMCIMKRDSNLMAAAVLVRCKARPCSLGEKCGCASGEEVKRTGEYCNERNGPSTQCHCNNFSPLEPPFCRNGSIYAWVQERLKY
jgi:hypothetical protein